MDFIEAYDVSLQRKQARTLLFGSTAVMMSSKTVLNIVLITVIGLVSLYEYIFFKQGLHTPCPVCNMSYSFYVQFLRLQVIWVLILENINKNRSKQKLINESILGMQRKLSVIVSKTSPIVLSLLFVFVIVTRTVIYLCSDSDFPWVLCLSYILSSICTFTCAIRFITTLSPVRESYIRLRETIIATQSAGQNLWANSRSHSLKMKECLVVACEIRRVHELVNDEFGKENCLIQFTVFFGLAVNAYILAYLNLLEWSSFWLNLSLLLTEFECGVTAFSYASAGYSAAGAAMTLLDEICRFPFRYEDKQCFDHVKYFMLSNIKEPTQITAWTFYSLSLESLFSTVTTAAAFVFVSLQFNSVYTKFGIHIL